MDLLSSKNRSHVVLIIRNIRTGLMMDVHLRYIRHYSTSNQPICLSIGRAGRGLKGLKGCNS